MSIEERLSQHHKQLKKSASTQQPIIKMTFSMRNSLETTLNSYTIAIADLNHQM